MLTCERASITCHCFCVKVKALHLSVQQASQERWTERETNSVRGAEKCVSEHWVTLLLNLSTSKVSPQGWGVGWIGTRGVEGESFRGKSESER